MAIEFESAELLELTPKIVVFGVGGAGCNAVANMIKAQLPGVDFVVANTDAQSLMSVDADARIQLGVEITQGLGAGSQPKVGEAAAEESVDLIDKALEGAHMCFITAGMGGGTGTGASPVIARRARENGILTVGVVTRPFHFEGGRRMKLADAGIKALQDHVDTLIIIPNQNLFSVSNDRTTFAEAFEMADDVLYSGVRSITDLVVVPGVINLDFADVRTVMSEAGKAMMGTGEASGENRAYEATEAAISNKLLEDASLKGASGVIINVTGGTDLALFEVDAAANMVRDLVDEDALIVFGSALDTSLDGQVRVSVVATGIEGGPAPKLEMPTRTVKPATAETQTPEAPAPANEQGDDTAEVAEDTDTATPVADGPADETQPTEGESTEPVLTVVADNDTAEAEPLDEMISRVEALERHAIEQQGGKSFVAEAPMPAKAEVTGLGQADVFRESDYVNSDTTPVEVEQSKPETKADTPKPEPVAANEGNFFMKVTKRFSSESSANTKAPAPAPQPAAEPAERDQRPEPSVSSAPNLGGLTAEDRPAPSASRGADQMEIPAFLKRQQN